MGPFAAVTRSRVPPGMTLPEPLRLLLDWVEDNGFVTTGDDRDLYGSLAGRWPRDPGTNVLLRGSPPQELGEHLAAWFGPVRDGLPVVWPFCRTGADGSFAALWQAPDGRESVVHLPSGSGSTTLCTLGDDAVDFLRLLAIGYDEVCWGEDWAEPPHPEEGPPTRNEPYRRWVETTFGVTIPQTGLEIVPSPGEWGDADSDDPWVRWVAAATA